MMKEVSFFTYDNFMPHGMCYAWQADVLWTSVISDLVTALAYYSVTAAVIIFVKKRTDLPYPWFFILAGSVIFLACGTTHLLSAVVIWEPIYGVSAVAKAITAISSLATGVAIWYVLPFFLAFPSPALLEKKNIALLQSLINLEAIQRQLELSSAELEQAKEQAEQKSTELFQLSQTLETKVQQRTHALESSNDLLSKEVADHKQARKQLQQLRNYLRNIIDSMPSTLIGVDLDGMVTQWNTEAAKASGVSAKNAQGRSLPQVFPRFVSVMEGVRQSIQSRRQVSYPKQPHQRGGETRYEDVTIYPLVANGIEGVVIRLDDVTEQVRMEETMIQSEKMLSVGGLAAGMAHEINNPLAGMMQTANVMKNRLSGLQIEANQKAAQAAGTDMAAIHAFMEARGILRMATAINESGRRLADIVDNMLNFARKGDASFSSQNLAELLDKTVELATTDYDLKKQYDFKNIEIIRDYAEDLPLVPCEPAKIQQVLLNILRNGAQAMQQAGVLQPCFTLRTQHQPDKSDQGWVCIEVEDNGPGMDETTRKRVFEPFFTTKPVGVGTGLGLSVSYFIITENHHGEMRVTSEPGRGSRFIIRLPLGNREMR
ncbi:MAG: ATP-binding protein [Motiliproteus sp.]